MKSDKNHLKDYIAWLLAITGLLWYSLALGSIIDVPGDYTTIQQAVDAAVPGDEVVVADGVYVGDGNLGVDFGGKAVVLRSENGPENCILDGEDTYWPVFFFNKGETAAAEVVGFTVRNGEFISGGAVYCVSSSPTIKNCVFENNSVTNYGGALYCRDGSPTFINCSFDRNSAKQGGAVCYSAGSPTFINCVMTRNSAESGGAIFIQSSNGRLVHCTLFDNTAQVYGPGIYCNFSFPTVVNSILWNDPLPDEKEIYISYGSEPQVVYSDVKGGWDGEGNIDSDPLFVAYGDAHLSEGSPCIDAGTREGELPEFDFEGDGRVLGQAPDMGADETAAKSVAKVDVAIAIDLKPGRGRNSINLKSRGVVPVAVFGSDAVNVSDIDFTTVKLAGAAPIRRCFKHVDRDGHTDVVFFFRTQDLLRSQDLVLGKGITEVTLSGTLGDGTQISGTDKVRIVPVRKCKVKAKIKAKTRKCKFTTFRKAKGRAACQCSHRSGH
jgi:predicted outer membrane repeat protein